MERPKSLHVDKPWGSFDQYALNTQCTVKILTCNPGQQLSLQRHRHRDELWVALDPGVVVHLDGVEIRPEPGREIWLPRAPPTASAAMPSRPARSGSWR